jgi:interferon gamma-inducible protein 30
MFFFLFTSSSASRILPSHSQKVSLGLYYESLCPYSANFIINYLPKLFETDLISIVDLNLVPWGNAKLRGNDTFDCQVTLLFVSFSNLLCGVFFDSTN